MDLSAADRAMVRLYMAGCLHYWDQLPGLARECLAAGATAEQLRGCVRHLVVFAGYGPCLAATLALHKAKLLPEDTPGKVDGPPGNAFELVYGPVTDRVRANMQAADPVLQEWIRLHLYGDVYSSPGLSLRQKQLLTCAFLAEAHMPDQLFGHALAALRFGNSRGAVEEVARLGLDMGPRAPDARAAVLKTALQNIDMAYAKYVKDQAGAPPHCPDVTILEPELSVRIPPLPPLVNTPEEAAAAGRPSGGGGGSDASVSVGLRPGGDGGKAGGGWGTSNIARPSAMAVDAIAARMEEQRARSGLFFGWQEDEGEGEPQEVLEDGAAAAAATS